MEFYSVLACDNYNDIYDVVRKHFEMHKVCDTIPRDAKILIKPNLVTDKEAAFSVTTNPLFVYAVVKYLRDNDYKNITVADCPGGALLLFSQMKDVYTKCGYDILSEYAVLNTDFEGVDIPSPENSVTKKFNVISAVKNADYIINVPKFKTHNLTGITCGVKNLFGCIPGLQKPQFHAKFPGTDDFSNMLVELAQTVKPCFTIVDAVDIMEGNGPTNGKKRHLGLTFAGENVFGLDSFVADFLSIPKDKVGTIVQSEKKNLIPSDYTVCGDKNFSLKQPLLLPESIRAVNAYGKFRARFNTLFAKISDAVFTCYPEMNEKCTVCCKCVMTCPQKALKNNSGKIVLEKSRCIGCMCCDEVCPNSAVDIKKTIRIGEK